MPAGYPELQQLILDQLDDRLDWLESLGAVSCVRETGNPHTVGRRFNPRDLVPALLRHAGDVLLGEPVGDVTDEPLVLATGGFGAALARRVSLPLRASPWSEGDSARARVAAGAPPRRREWTSSTAARFQPRQPSDGSRTSYGCRRCTAATPRVLDEIGAAVECANGAWHENDLVQEIARRPQGRAWFLVGEDVLDTPVGDATVGERIEAAREAGGTVVDPGELPFPAPASGTHRGARHSLRHAHDRRPRRRPRGSRARRRRAADRRACYAAGVDVGGIATGGYSSGLAAALVLGCVAAESVAAVG